MKLYRKLWSYWLHRQGIRVALELAAVMREYKTRLALHGNAAYIYADVLAPMAGRIEALTVRLEFINAQRDRLKTSATMIGLPVIDPSMLEAGK